MKVLKSGGYIFIEEERMCRLAITNETQRE